MEQLLRRQGKLFKDLKCFVLQQSDRIKEHARQLAQESGRPYEYHVTRVPKEQRAKEIAQRDDIAHLFRYAEVFLSTNRRDLDALATVRDPTPAFRELNRFAKPVRLNGRPLHGFNPIDLEDLNTLRAALRGLPRSATRRARHPQLQESRPPLTALPRPPPATVRAHSRRPHLAHPQASARPLPYRQDPSLPPLAGHPSRQRSHGRRPSRP
jgi:hypothetical protein